MTAERHPCEDHTPRPEGYIQWHDWAESMAKTHKQRRCEGCGRYAIWEPKDVDLAELMKEQDNG